jgi:menaquinone-9 beta-reductase
VRPFDLAVRRDRTSERRTQGLIVGADGRGSGIARQIGARAQAAPARHLLAGLLVKGVGVWPAEEFSIGTEGDVTFFVFPQGDGEAPLYLAYRLDQRRRFSGTGSERRFLDAFRLSSLPEKEMFTFAEPIGPCRSYPNSR